MPTKKTALDKNETTTEKNPEVVIYLDRPRFVRFGHKSLKKLSALLNINLAQMDETQFDLGDIEKVMYCGIMHDAKQHGENLTLDQMEDLLDCASSYGDILAAMNKALDVAFQETEKQKN
jgi:ribosome-interacting GTPase 1